MRQRIQTDWPLVTLPGTLCDARVFGPMLADAGASDRAVLPVDLTQHDSARTAALAALSSLPERFIAVGFSLGAIVALEMAVQAPDRVGALVLLAANGRDVPLADHAPRRAMADADPVRLVGETLWPRYVAPARLDDAPLRALITDMARAAPPGTLARQTGIALTRSDKRPMLPTITAPALIIGGAHDAVAPPALQHELAAGLPHARLLIAPDAGHFVPLECPDLCANALRQWLADHHPLS